MARLSKAETRRHTEALTLLDFDDLTNDSRETIFRNFHPGADHNTTERGAFFTPFDLAGDFAIECNGARRILDLCAGIGVLSVFPYWRGRNAGQPVEITCVELNPAYAEAGRKIAPWATWIEADAWDVTTRDIGSFDLVIANPPFGRVRSAGRGPRYTGAEAELHLIDHAAQFAPRGAFIIPAMSAPFQYSGAQCYARREQGRGIDFERQTGITLEAGAGVDCSIYRDDWMGTTPSVEIVCAEFSEARPVQAGLDLFGIAA